MCTTMQKTPAGTDDSGCLVMGAKGAPVELK
jgi:hypothetical protein